MFWGQVGEVGATEGREARAVGREGRVKERGAGEDGEEGEGWGEKVGSVGVGEECGAIGEAGVGKEVKRGCPGSLAR